MDDVEETAWRVGHSESGGVGSFSSTGSMDDGVSQNRKTKTDECILSEHERTPEVVTRESKIRDGKQIPHKPKKPEGGLTCRTVEVTNGLDSSVGVMVNKGTLRQAHAVPPRADPTCPS